MFAIVGYFIASGVEGGRNELCLDIQRDIEVEIPPITISSSFLSEEDAQKKTSSLVFIGGTACVWIWLDWAPKFPGDCHFHYFEQLLSLLLMSILQRDQNISSWQLSLT